MYQEVIKSLYRLYLKMATINTGGLGLTDWIQNLFREFLLYAFLSCHICG